MKLPLMKTLIVACLLISVGCGNVTGTSSSGKGAQAPSFTAMGLDNQEVNLDRYIGKGPLLLVFFATWCPPCRKEVPALINAQDEYSNRGLNIVAVSVDDSIGKVQTFAKERGINYTVVHDNEGTGSQLYKVVGIPTNLLVTKDGVIAFREHRMPDGKEIESILE